MLLPSAGAFEGESITRIGYVSQFGNVSKQVVMTKTEGTTGMTGAWVVLTAHGLMELVRHNCVV